MLNPMGVNPVVCMQALEKVKNYSSSTHSNYFSYIIFRIKSAVLSIFGASDWQAARNDLTREFKKVESLLPDTLRQCIEISDIADSVLGIYVDITDITENFKKQPEPKAVFEAVQSRFDPILSRITKECKDENIKSMASLAQRFLSVMPKMGPMGPVEIMMLQESAETMSDKVSEMLLTEMEALKDSLTYEDQEKFNAEMSEYMKSLGRAPTEDEIGILMVKFLGPKIVNAIAPKMIKIAEQILDMAEKAAGIPHKA